MSTLTESESDTLTLLALDAGLSDSLPCGVVSFECDRPATHRLVVSCGCRALLCDSHAVRAEYVAHDALSGGPTLECPLCGSEDIELVELVRINA